MSCPPDCDRTVVALAPITRHRAIYTALWVAERRATASGASSLRTTSRSPALATTQTPRTTGLSLTAPVADPATCESLGPGHRLEPLSARADSSLAVSNLSTRLAACYAQS